MTISTFKTSTRNLSGFLLLLGSLLLVACSDGNSSIPQSQDASANSGGQTPSDNEDDVQQSVQRDQYPFGIACGWEVASNTDLMNIAYPDESAKYWVSMVPMIPGTRLRINGRYAALRYFSFNVYDPMLRPSDAIADFEITPDEGGENPFVKEGAGYGDTYTVYVEFTGKPENPAPNTVYAGEFFVADAALPQPLMTGLFYRSYAPNEGFDFDGGVGLPILTLETADGEVELLPTADCVEPLLPTLGNTLPELGLNDVLGEVDFPDDPFLLANGQTPLGLPDVQTHKFHGLPEFYFVFLAELLGLPIGEQINSIMPETGGGGFLSNIHNAYTYSIYYRSKGNVILFRAKAPTYRTQAGVPFASEQLRYWSVCQNEVASQRYFACIRDDEALLDDQGYFTVIISDEADRPANAVDGNDINWMPWGPYLDAGVIYRHMLPNENYVESIHDVERGQNVDDVMGEYAPQAAYCTREIVEAAGAKPADIFAACREYTENLASP